MKEDLKIQHYRGNRVQIQLLRNFKYLDTKTCLITRHVWYSNEETPLEGRGSLSLTHSGSDVSSVEHLLAYGSLSLRSENMITSYGS